MDTNAKTEALTENPSDILLGGLDGLAEEALNNALFGGTYSNVIGGADSTLTLGKVMEACRQVEALGPPPPQVRIYETEAAVRIGPRARVYPRRRAKSDRHWRRMDKKWQKRYGFQMLPTAYEAQCDLFGRPEISIFVHPALAGEYRAALKAAESPWPTL